MSIELKPVIMVLSDISGYTSFLQQHRMEILHAERIITELIEAVLDKADYPLEISKLEGDAVFMYSEFTGPREDVTHDVVKQAFGFFDAFKAKAEELIQANMCPCDSCTSIKMLRLKTIIHTGEVAFKQIRHFSELAGNDVILIHRLLKNDIQSSEYLALTSPVRELAGDLPDMPSAEHVEPSGGYGDIPLLVFYPQGVPPVDMVHVKSLPERLWWHTKKMTYQIGRMLGIIKGRAYRNIIISRG